MLSLFSNNSPDLVISSVYGLPKPNPVALAKREKAVARVKKLFADKLRCNVPVPRLEKPL